jgi:hypothetical protein
MGAAESRVIRVVSILALILTAAWIPAAGGIAAASEVASFRLSQAVAAPPEVIAYLEILDRQNNLVPVGQDQLSAALGSSGATIKGLARFQDQGEGVAYILLVDISKSLKEKEFAQMRKVLAGWIDMMSLDDRAAIMTFGQDVRMVLDFTNDKEVLKDEVSQLGPVDMHTQLHLGLIRALEMGRRTDPNLPRRRAIVTLSDGQDDFAGGATKAEVLAHFQVDPIPIYAIGFYSPPRKSAKEESLKILGEFARTSGGSYFRAQTGDFGKVYNQIWRRIHEVYVATLDSKQGPWNGAVSHLQMDLAAGPKALRAGLDLRLPSWKPKEEEIITGETIPDKETVKKPWWDFLPALEIRGLAIPGWAYGSTILALLALTVALIILLHQRRQSFEEPGAYASPPWQDAGPTGGPIMANKVNFPEGPATAGPTVPIAGAPVGAGASKGVKVRLTFIRSQASVPPLEFTLTHTMVIGRNKPPSDLVIPQDKEVSRKHCQLSLDDGAIKILDLGSKNGTLVNGVPITGQYRLKHDDIIRIGKTELRVSII